MRKEIINLQCLKRSKTTKHNKIYEKAHRLMNNNFKTVEYTDEEVLQKALNFPSLKVKVLMNGDILVRSKRDEWFIRDEVRFLTLYHEEKYMYKGRMKERYHIQDVFEDIEYIFASIVSHDEFVIKESVIYSRDVGDLVNKYGTLSLDKITSCV